MTGRDPQAMERALALAEDAAAFVSPNPAVGCVVVDEAGLVLGEKAHFYDARDHAEIAALKDATAKGLTARGATAFVTLEPCSHHGRTGPCADALVEAGIARCVVATLDPNPLVGGQGAAKLRAAGVRVEVLPTTDPSAQRARRLNDAFAFSIVHGRPFVTLKAALSVDGKLAPAAANRRAARAPHWLTGENAREDVQRLRHASDALITGIGTVLADDPTLTDRTGADRRRKLRRVVLDTGLRLPFGSKVAQSADGDVIVYCGESAHNDAEHRLVATGVQVVRLPAVDGKLALEEVLADLSLKEIRSVLLEAGSSLNGAFLRAGLVDRVVLYFAETELGAGALPFAEGYGSPFVLQQSLSRVERTSFTHGAGEDVRVSGYLHDPWDSDASGVS